MGIARVKKVALITHQVEKDELLKSLQQAGILHISKIKETKEEDSTLKNKLLKLQRIIEFLKPYIEKKKGLSGFLKGKKEISLSEFLNLPREFNFEEISEKINSFTERLKQLDSEEKNLQQEYEILFPWKFINYPPAELYKMKKSVPVFLKAEFPSKTFISEEIPVVVVEEKEDQGKFYILLLVEKEYFDIFLKDLKNLPCEVIDLSKILIPIPERVKEIEERLTRIKEQRKNIETKIKHLTSYFEKLEILMDFYENDLQLKKIERSIISTKTSYYIEGWIKVKDEKKLQDIISRFPYTTYTEIAPKEDEKPPVALENKKIFKPFELLLELYGTPLPNELDPTPFLAPFFSIFFGICLTDAGYGIFLIFFILLAILKFKIKNRFLNILFAGGIFTVIAGALTGGWFGDLFDKIGLGFLVEFKKTFMLFDPFKNPMPFLLIALGFGYLQLLWGIGLEVYDSLRHRNYGCAFFENLPWIVFLVSILSIFFLKEKSIAWSLILLSLSVITALSYRPEKTSFIEGFVFWFFFFSLFLLLGVRFKLVKTVPYLYIKYIFFLSWIFLFVHSLAKTIKNKLKSGYIWMVICTVFVALYCLRISPKFSFILAVVSVLLFGVSTSKGWGGRIAWGLYNVYGATGFLGIILSYIRLMALGMVTGGIAMAINTMAWMVINIPVLGIILALIILMIGHIYNIGINTLGGVVHSLRLQYVEFFPRFFTGGGERFSPFSLRTKTVKIKEV